MHRIASSSTFELSDDEIVNKYFRLNNNVLYRNVSVRNREFQIEKNLSSINSFTLFQQQHQRDECGEF